MCLYTHDYTIRAQSYYFFLDYAIEAPLFTKIYVYRLAVYCLTANAILCAKLVKVFEEAKFRCVKVQFFSGSVV